VPAAQDSPIHVLGRHYDLQEQKRWTVTRVRFLKPFFELTKLA
jgi:hypothetical protein